jgi:hypothetical protein
MNDPAQHQHVADIGGDPAHQHERYIANINRAIALFNRRVLLDQGGQRPDPGAAVGQAAADRRGRAGGLELVSPAVSRAEPAGSLLRPAGLLAPGRDNLRRRFGVSSANQVYKAHILQHDSVL